MLYNIMSTSQTELKGATTITQLLTNSITSTNDLFIQPPITDDIYIKTIANSSGKIDIMTGSSSSGSVNILTGFFATGIIDIGGDSTTSNIKGNIVNIENTDESSSTVNIMTGLDAIGTITIGATNVLNNTTTTISGNSTINKLSLIAPITSAYTVVPTSNQIGYLPPTILNAGDATLLPNNTTMTVSTNQSFAKIELTAGTWILTGSLIANANATFGSVVVAITPAQSTFSFTTDWYVQSANNASLNFGFLATRIVQVTATQYYFLTARTTATSQIVNTYKLIATRIA